MSTSQPLNADEFRFFLQRCRQRFLLHAAARGLARLSIITVAVIVLSAGLDYLWPLPGGVRLGLLIVDMAIISIACWRFVLQPLMTDIPDAELGAAVDLARPEFHEAVATVVSIESPEATNSESGSALMRERLWRQMGQQLGSDSSSAIMDHHATRNHCLVAACVLGVALIPLITWQSGSLLLLQRLVKPLVSLPTATNLYFEVLAPGAIAARGTDVVFQAMPQWRDEQQHPLPEHVQVVFTADSGHTDTLALRYDSSSENYMGTLHAISDSVTWRVESGRTATANHVLQVVDGPQQTDGSLTATPPDYTGLPASTFAGATGLMEVFAGSRVEVHLEFNKPIDVAELVWQETEEQSWSDISESDSALPPQNQAVARSMVLAPDGRSADLSFTAERSGVFQLKLRDEHGLVSLEDSHRELLLIEDQPPKLTVQGIQTGDELRADDIIPVNCVATDDIGIGDLELHLQVGDKEPEVLPATGDHRGLTQTAHGFRVNLADRQLPDGAQISLRVRVTDERRPTPHEVWSDGIAVVIDSDARPIGAAALGEETRQMLDQLEAVRQQVSEDAETVRELRRTRADDWTDESSQNLTQLGERQQMAGRQLESLGQQAGEHPLMKSPAKALRQLGQSLRATMAEQLQHATEKDRQNEQSLTMAEDQLRNTWTELGQIIKEVRQAGELEQDLAELNRLALQAEQLARTAQELQQEQQTDEGDLPAGTNLEARNQQLQQQSQAVEETRQELTSDLTDLLSEQQQLQQAAQQALRERQRDVAGQAEALAERQQQLATLMEFENSADPAQTAAAQEQVARETASLNEDLNDIGKQVSLPGVGLADRSSAVEAARQSAQTATQQTQSAGESMRKGDLSEAAAAAGEAASALDRVAQLDQQSSPDLSKQLSVPAEVGQSVTDALHNLTTASEPTPEFASSDNSNDADQADADGTTAPQEADDAAGEETASSEPANSDAANKEDAGDASDTADASPQPSAPKDGTGQAEKTNGKRNHSREQQLADAAAALSDAAWASLPDASGGRMPQLPLPGNFAGAGSTDNTPQQQGLSNTASIPSGEQRDWGQLHDELGKDILSDDPDAVDGRYASMIRAYFRELARSSLKQPSP